MATFFASSCAALPLRLMDSSDMQAFVSPGTVSSPSASIAAPFLMTSLFHSAEVYRTILLGSILAIFLISVMSDMTSRMRFSPYSDAAEIAVGSASGS